jgi:hypothetical protein
VQIARCFEDGGQVRHPRNRAYYLAATQSTVVRTRYSVARRRLIAAACLHRLSALERLLLQGRAAINVSLSTCLRVLQTGRFLTAFEAAAQAAGSPRGSAFEDALKERLGRFYSARVAIERMLLLDGKTTYAALHVGGTGPDYGPCCVVLESTGRYTRSTCFAGDTIKTVFDRNGRQVTPRSAVLKRLATRRLMPRLGAIYYQDVLLEDTPEIPLDVTRLRNMLCERSTLLEIQIHESVLATNIERIVIAARHIDSLRKRLKEFARATRAEQRAQQFDDVRTYVALLKWANLRRVNIVQGE